MLQQTTPPGSIVVDVTAQDTGHRTRGIGRYARSLWRAMAEIDQDVVALRLTDAGRSWRADLSMTHLWRFVEAQSRLGAQLEKAGCTVFGATEPWVLPRESKRLRVVPTCHDLIPVEMTDGYPKLKNVQWTIYWQWLRSTRALSRCSKVIVPSEATRKSVVEYLEVDANDVVVIPHGIDHDRFFVPSDDEVARVRSALNIGSEPYLLYVGGYDFRKNIPRLIEGFAASGCADEVLLVLAGPGGVKEKTRMFDAARDAGVQHRVVWPGHVPDGDLNGLYGGAHAFMYPSLMEGFGLQTLEAMACGCPVVTSNCSSLVEVAQDAAMLVEPTSVESIAAAIRALDSTTCDELRLAGLQRARTFDWSKTARATLDVYREVA